MAEGPDGEIEDDAENSWKTIRVDGQAYRVQVVSPKFHDRHERGRAATKSLLLVFLIMVFVVSDLFGIFSIIGTLLRK